MSTLRIDMAVNDDNGNYTGFVERIAIYPPNGDIEALLDISGPEMAHGVSDEETGQLVLQIGGGVMHAYSYSEYVGNLVWDAATIDIADAAKVIKRALARGWTWEEGCEELFRLYMDAREITVKDLQKAMEPA